MNYDKSLLGQDLSEIRNVKIPKLDFSKQQNQVKKLPSEIVKVLKDLWDSIARGGLVSPRELRFFLIDTGIVFILLFYSLKLI
jgi:hypothetical protein